MGFDRLYEEFDNIVLKLKNNQHFLDEWKADTNTQILKTDVTLLKGGLIKQSQNPPLTPAGLESKNSKIITDFSPIENRHLFSEKVNDEMTTPHIPKEEKKMIKIFPEDEEEVKIRQGDHKFTPNMDESVLIQK